MNGWQNKRSSLKHHLHFLNRLALASKQRESCSKTDGYGSTYVLFLKSPLRPYAGEQLTQSEGSLQKSTHLVRMTWHLSASLVALMKILKSASLVQSLEAFNRMHNAGQDASFWSLMMVLAVLVQIPLSVPTSGGCRYLENTPECVQTGRL